MQLKITRGKGFHAIMDNGVTLSVQIGGGNYCDNYDEQISPRDPFYNLPSSGTAEIAVWLSDGKMLELLSSGDTVAGYVPVQDVFRAIARLIALIKPTPEEVVDALGLTED